MDRRSTIVLAAALIAGCHAEKRLDSPARPDTAQLIVTSNRAVTNQWVRLHSTGCEAKGSKVLGALNNETSGWPATGNSLTSAVPAGPVRVGVVGSVSEPILNARGHIEGFHYAACYPVVEFTARAGYSYHVQQNSVLVLEGKKAVCGYEIQEETPTGETSSLSHQVTDCTGSEP